MFFLLFFLCVGVAMHASESNELVVGQPVLGRNMQLRNRAVYMPPKTQVPVQQKGAIPPSTSIAQRTPRPRRSKDQHKTVRSAIQKKNPVDFNTPVVPNRKDTFSFDDSSESLPWPPAATIPCLSVEVDETASEAKREALAAQALANFCASKSDTPTSTISNISSSVITDTLGIPQSTAVSPTRATLPSSNTPVTQLPTTQPPVELLENVLVQTADPTHVEQAAHPNNPVSRAPVTVPIPSQFIPLSSILPDNRDLADNQNFPGSSADNENQDLDPLNKDTSSFLPLQLLKKQTASAYLSKPIVPGTPQHVAPAQQPMPQQNMPPFISSMYSYNYSPTVPNSEVANNITAQQIVQSIIMPLLQHCTPDDQSLVIQELVKNLSPMGDGNEPVNDIIQTYPMLHQELPLLQPQYHAQLVRQTPLVSTSQSHYMDQLRAILPKSSGSSQSAIDLITTVPTTTTTTVTNSAVTENILPQLQADETRGQKRKPDTALDQVRPQKISKKISKIEEFNKTLANPNIVEKMLGKLREKKRFKNSGSVRRYAPLYPKKQ